MERFICSTEVEFWSADVAMFSAMAPTSSMEAAISLIDEDVCSAAAARSLAWPATPSIEREISSMAAAVSFTALVSSSVSRLIVRVAADDCVIEVADLLRRSSHFVHGQATDWIDAEVSCIAPALIAADPARLRTLAVTCSIDADISVIELTSCSAEADTDALCVEVSLSEALISLTPLSASSRLRVCCSAPAANASASRVSVLADTLNSGTASRRPARRYAAGSVCRSSSHCLSLSALPCIFSCSRRWKGFRKRHQPIEVEHDNQPPDPWRQCLTRSRHPCPQWPPAAAESPQD